MKVPVFKAKNRLFPAIFMLGLVACGETENMGSATLLVKTDLKPMNQHCAAGGTQIDSGRDTNKNGILDDNEILSTSFECQAAQANIVAADIVTSTENSWYLSTQDKVSKAVENFSQIQSQVGAAKNVILFVGDGMGISTVTAARILEGQLKGMPGEDNQLSFGKFPFTGFSKTYNVDAQTPDSAGTMTAIITGVKTDAGVIAIDENVERGDCKSQKGNELISALELAEIAGKSTGIVTTARVTHATPAATYAKAADRNWEDNSDMPEDAISGGCEDIASQLVNFESLLEARFPAVEVDGIEVVMGGGRRHFLPADANLNSTDAVSEIEGDRTDGRNLIAEWRQKYPDGSYVFNEQEFNKLDVKSVKRVFGLFNESHMRYEADRKNDAAGEPSLSDMTKKAIEILDNNPDGFFLMVESGRIDHAHHAGNAYNALMDTIELSNAVRVAKNSTSEKDTLIIVTADHGHVFTIAGYPKRGNPILGKVVGIGEQEPTKAKDGMPYTTVGYMNGLGFRDLGDETDADVSYELDSVNVRQDLTGVNTRSSGFHQEAFIPTGAETHSGEDVGIYASGPGAHLVSGTNEQSIIYHVINHAAGYLPHDKATKTSK